MFMNQIFTFENRNDCVNRDPFETEDYYGMLGCYSSSTTEQIIAEYRARVLHCHPDKCGTTESPVECEKRKMRFCQLHQAKEVLTDAERRKDYDRWRDSGLSLSYHKWCHLRATSGLHGSIHWLGAGSRRAAKPALTCATDFTATPDPMNKTNVGKGNLGMSSMTMNTDKLDDFRRFDHYNSSDSLLKQFRNYEI